MANNFEVNVEEVEPMSRTYQYRKVMKPMLERKRRARINKCLDELKDLMVGALQSEGESITKLEKADVLELTVRHLRKLKQHHALAIPAQNHAHEKFRAGFAHCASEVRRFVQSVPGVDMHVSARLLTHLGQWVSQIDKVGMPTSLSPAGPNPPQLVTVDLRRVYTPPASPDSKPPVFQAPVPSVHSIQHPMPTPSVRSAPLALTAYDVSINCTPLNLHKSQAKVPPVMKPSSPHMTPTQQRSPPNFTANSSPQPVTAISARSSPSPTYPKIPLPSSSPVWRPW